MRVKFRTLMANQWARGFLRNCRKTMTPLVQDMKSLENAIKRDAQLLFDQRVDTLPDKQGYMILAMCSLVLAAFRQLKESLEPGLAFDTVRSAFERTYATPMRWYFRVWLWLSRDPVAFLQRMSLAKYARRMYGACMEVSEEKKTNSVDMLVTHCYYHQFFVDHGEPGLTLLVCAWDRNWMNVVDESPRAIRTERPTTISTGGDCCRFRYVRDDDKLDKSPNDIVLIQLEKAVEPASEWNAEAG